MLDKINGSCSQKCRSLRLVVLLVSVSVGDGSSLFAQQDRSFLWTNRLVLGVEEHLTADLTFSDVDLDGDMDVLVANGRHWPQPNEVFLNNGKGRFTVSYELGPERATTYAVPAGDLDGDGDPDVVVANDMALNWVYLNEGQGRFERAWPVGPEV